MAFAGVATIPPQPPLGLGIPPQWSDIDKDKIGKKPVVAPKKRRKGPEKDSTPVPPSRSIVSRVRVLSSYSLRH